MTKQSSDLNMSTMQLRLLDGVHVLTLTNNEHENKLNIDVMGEYHRALDAVENYEGNTALLITCEHEKTFSTGIDLEWLGSQTPEGVQNFVLELERVLYRLAMFNAPTIACINGNAYAGGAILLTALDFRVMRADRGRFCYPEVNIHIPFTEMMTDIIGLVPNKHVLKQMALLGTPLTGEECVAADVVDAIYPLQALQQEAMNLAVQLAQKDRNTYTTIKRRMREGLTRHAEALGY